jgi:hypothetical protein
VGGVYRDQLPKGTGLFLYLKNREIGTSTMMISALPQPPLTDIACVILVILALIAVFKPQAIDVLIRLLDALYRLLYDTSGQQKRKRSGKKQQRGMKKG